MRRLTFVLLTALLALGLASTASAQSAKFHSVDADVNQLNQLVVTFDQRGLGSSESFDFTVTADATAVYACFNRGGHNPEAANKETVAGPVSESGTFDSTKNGRVQGSLTADAPGPGGFSCPSGQRLVLESACYSNIVLTNTTTNTEETIAGPVCSS